jgi:hypothetical protein
MWLLVLLSTLMGAVSQAGTLSCELVYAKDGNAQRTSKSIQVNKGEEGKVLELSINNLVESQVFRGSNGKITAHLDRIGGESNYSVTDGNLLHLTAENSNEGRALTCTYAE